MTEKILVGQKPSMAYVLNSVTRLKGEKKINILARGKNISKAVDIAELLTKKFMTNLKVKEIKIDTETYKDSEGNERKTSSIEIMLSEE